MEQYKRHRKVLRVAFSKIGNELEQLLTAERTDLQDIQVHWDLLEDKYGSLQDINKNVFDSLLESDAPEEELGAEMESCDGYMKRFKLLKYKYEQLRGTTGSINEERASIVSRPASNVSGTTGKKPVTDGIGHPSRKCRQRVRCLICKRSHVALMCPDLPENKSNFTQQPAVNEEKNENEIVPPGHALANYTGTHVFSQT
ncbi:hypothetical protein JTB14_007916 [Gonioctena quinquepunctata]|nr:hypothetical protein JTB14_007916 [Gonioctena quinquepunctata]